MKTIAILGSTGSIGKSTLDVIRRNRDQYRIWALVAGQNVDELAAQVLEFHPEVVVTATDEVLSRLRDQLGASALSQRDWPHLGAGSRARVEAATAGEVDFVMSAIVGVAGMEATHAAARLGKTIGLANKELLVASGALLMETAARHGAELIPVDSEHNGAHQCLRAGRRAEVARLILTASGGPFWNQPLGTLRNVTPEQALNHPTWRMGKRISLDSATLMNKGFEVIEACWLFGFKPSEVDVVIHPQSKVHAMVEYVDGSVLAQIATTDMRMPIQYALTYPDRKPAAAPRLEWDEARRWEFYPPDFGKFPLLKLAYRAQETGGSATCTLNSADEVAAGIVPALGDSVSTDRGGCGRDSREDGSSPMASVAEVLEIDGRSRATARAVIDGKRTLVSAGASGLLATA